MSQKNRDKYAEELLSSKLKKCSKCKKIKDIDLFYPSRYHVDNCDSWCRKCKLLANQAYVKNVEKAKETREFRKMYDRKQRLKLARIKHRYKLSADKYSLLLQQQDNLCAICNVSLNLFGKNTHIDYCHKTKKIRGLLCGNCNQGLGNFRDDINFLNSAIDYLKSQGTPGTTETFK
jgi:hypothetical protein